MAVNVAATIGCLLLDGRAEGHPELAPSTVNHYIKLDLVAADEVRLAYTVMVGPGPAAAWRRAADANADGRVDDAEAQALGARARAAALRAMALEADGVKIVPAFETPVVGMAGAEVAPEPFSVDLVARLKLPAAARHTLRLDDRSDEKELGETEILVEESPATRLVASHRGAEGNDKQTRFLFRGPKFSVLEDRSITVLFEGTKKPAPSSGCGFRR